jgi:hypothetical protein
VQATNLGTVVLVLAPFHSFVPCWLGTYIPLHPLHHIRQCTDAQVVPQMLPTAWTPPSQLIPTQSFLLSSHRESNRRWCFLTTPWLDNIDQFVCDNVYFWMHSCRACTFPPSRICSASVVSFDSAVCGQVSILRMEKRQPHPPVLLFVTTPSVLHLL